MRRTASEVIRDLERRIARLEKQASNTYTHILPVEITDFLYDENGRVIAQEGRRWNFQGRHQYEEIALEKALVSLAQEFSDYDIVFEESDRDTLKFYYADNTPYFEDEFDEDDLDRCASVGLEIKLINPSREHLKALREIISDIRRFKGE